MLGTIVFGTCALGLSVCVFALIRNEWVYHQQMAYHREAFDRPTEQWWRLGRPSTDDLCESYEAMFWRFWVWDRESFRKRRLPPPSPNNGESK